MDDHQKPAAPGGTQLDAFLEKFASWLIEAGHAETKHDANRLAWDFVAGAWDGDDDLASWVTAYEDGLASTAEDRLESDQQDKDQDEMYND